MLFPNQRLSGFANTDERSPTTIDRNPMANIILGVCFYGYLEWQEVKGRRDHNLKMERLDTIERSTERAHKVELQKRAQVFQAEQNALYREQRERQHLDTRTADEESRSK